MFALMVTGNIAGLVLLPCKKGAEVEGNTFELKYCERCGALGVRHSESSESYCEPCGRVLSEASPPSAWAERLRKVQPGLFRRMRQAETARPAAAVGVLP